MLTATDISNICPSLRGLAPVHLQALSSCAGPAAWKADAHIFHEGEHADAFYILLSGRVNLQMTPPGHGRITIQTIRSGEILGWSWLFPPYRWNFDAIASETTEAVRVEAACLRAKLEVDAHLRAELMGRFARVMLQRLQATRLQLMDVYGSER